MNSAVSHFKALRGAVSAAPANSAAQAMPSPALGDFSAAKGATNTTRERQSMASGVNLADAHSRQQPTPSQRLIVEQLPTLYKEAIASKQIDLEDRFIRDFLELAGEPIPNPTSRCMLSYSSSCAITMLASYFGRHHKRVALLEPIFDNIPSILQREGVDLVPLTERSCEVDALARIHRLREFSVLWLVCPNNPTGWSLTRSEFEATVAWCAKMSVIVVLDASFRFFSPPDWSRYEILDGSGASYVVLEDTGKTWPTNEMKIGLTVSSADLYSAMYRLHDDLLQGVSPFHLRVLLEFMALTKSETSLISSHMALVRSNRLLLRSLLRSAPVRFLTTESSPVSVDWLVVEGDFDAEQWRQAAALRGVYVLSGLNFFWCNRERGRRNIRVPLARDPSLLNFGGTVLCETASLLSKNAENEPND